MGTGRCAPYSKAVLFSWNSIQNFNNRLHVIGFIKMLKLSSVLCKGKFGIFPPTFPPHSDYTYSHNIAVCMKHMLCYWTGVLIITGYEPSHVGTSRVEDRGEAVTVRGREGSIARGGCTQRSGYTHPAPRYPLRRGLAFYLLMMYWFQLITVCGNIVGYLRFWLWCKIFHLRKSSQTTHTVEFK